MKPHIAIMRCGRWGVWGMRFHKKQGRWPVARGHHMQSAIALAALVASESCERAASTQEGAKNARD